MQAAHDHNLWLDIEIRGSATLKDIDAYLRAIWLECCGHLSQFSIGGWQGNAIATSRRVAAIWKSEDVEVTHIYDFGTSSEMRITLLGERSGAPFGTRPIVLLARNY